MASNHKDFHIGQTEENFLKTMILLQRRHGIATPSDMEGALSYKTSTVYNLVNKLDSEGYIIAVRGTRSKKPSLMLTDKGREIAEKIFIRHQKIQDWLMLLGIDEEEAEAEACLFEHGLSDATMEIISRHVNMAKANFGKDSPYPEKMMEMALAMQSSKIGMTETDKMLENIAKHGGYETLIHQSEVLTELGGEEFLREKLKAVRGLGGLKGIYARDEELTKMGGLEEFKRLRDSLDTFGGVKKLYELEEILSKLGGLKRIKHTIELYESYGDTKKIREKTAVLEELEALGGLKSIKKTLSAIEALGGLEEIGKTYKKLEKIQHLLSDN